MTQGVNPLVISFCNSSNVNPTDNNAATLAIGNPVAFEAKAEERLTLDSFQLQPPSHFQDYTKLNIILQSQLQFLSEF